MKLVIDTNVLISALLKNSVTREILLFPSLEFVLPEYALEEIEAHKDSISRRYRYRRAYSFHNVPFTKMSGFATSLYPTYPALLMPSHVLSSV